VEIELLNSTALLNHELARSGQKGLEMSIWHKATKEASQHLQNASAAHLAKIESSQDMPRGSGRVVDHHLDRIRDREIGLYDFARAVGGLTKDATDKG